jgi:prophage regulatory protein
MTAFVKMKELLDLVGMSRSALYERITKGGPRYDPTFPQPIRAMSASGKQTMLRWSRKEVEQWLSKMGAEVPKPARATDAEKELERLRDDVIRVNWFFEHGKPITGHEALKDLVRSINEFQKYFSNA